MSTTSAAADSSLAVGADASPAAHAAGPVYTVQGRTIALPVVVRDALSISAVYAVPSGAVHRLLPTPALHVPELFPGRALCVLAAVEYRDNDLGQYNEVAVNFFVTRGGRRPLPFFGLLAGFRRREIGAYVHRLPVTTSFSCDAGRDIWGFPKTVEEITFHDEGGWRTCTLRSGGAHVLTLSVVRGGRRRFDSLAQDAYAWRDGVLFKTPSVMGGEGVGTRLGGARLTLGAHPLADELRSLGLPKRALMSSSFDRMWASFGAPQAL